MSSASRPCKACGRPTDRYSELCVHCQRGRTVVSTRPATERQWAMSATALVIDSDDADGEDFDSRYAIVAD
jgi:hypothetical protein